MVLEGELISDFVGTQTAIQRRSLPASRAVDRAETHARAERGCKSSSVSKRCGQCERGRRSLGCVNLPGSDCREISAPRRSLLARARETERKRKKEQGGKKGGKLYFALISRPSRFPRKVKLSQSRRFLAYPDPFARAFPLTSLTRSTTSALRVNAPTLFRPTLVAKGSRCRSI